MIALRNLLGLLATIVFLPSCGEDEVGVGVSSVKWLPFTASDINYAKGIGWDAYDCKMTEKNFISGTKSDGLSAAEFAKPFKITRYSWSDSVKGGPPTMHTVNRGLHVQEYTESMAGYDLLYDRDEERVFYYYQRS